MLEFNSVKGYQLRGALLSHLEMDFSNGEKKCEAFSFIYGSLVLWNLLCYCAFILICAIIHPLT